MKTKVCRKCGEEKRLSEFYEHPQMADGHLNKCKECKIEYQRQYRLENHEKVCAYDRKRYQRPERKEYAQRLSKKYKENHPRKTKARSKVWSAIRDGQLERPDACEDCGCTDQTLQAHHEDYSKPLDVIWLCFQCHRKRHGQIVEIEGDPY